MKNITIDKQFDSLPKKVIFCKNCVVSNQRPRTKFDKNGICSACNWAKEKNLSVDWNKREKELQALCDMYRSNNGKLEIGVRHHAISSNAGSIETAGLSSTKFYFDEAHGFNAGDRVMFSQQSNTDAAGSPKVQATFIFEVDETTAL